MLSLMPSVRNPSPGSELTSVCGGMSTAAFENELSQNSISFFDETFWIDEMLSFSMPIDVASEYDVSAGRTTQSPVMFEPSKNAISPSLRSLHVSLRLVTSIRNDVILSFHGPSPPLAVLGA